MYNYCLCSAGNNVKTYRILNFNYFQTIFLDGYLYDKCEMTNLWLGLNPGKGASNSGKTGLAPWLGFMPRTGLEGPVAQVRTLAGLCEGGNPDP